MAPTTDGPVPFPDLAGFPAGVLVPNDCWRIHERDGYRVVSLCGLPVLHYAAGDRAGEADAMVSLVDLGWAARWCARSAATFAPCDATNAGARGGLVALGRPPDFPRGRSQVPPDPLPLTRLWVFVETNR
jgi:hypothetical protein